VISLRVFHSKYHLEYWVKDSGRRVAPRSSWWSHRRGWPPTSWRTRSPASISRPPENEQQQQRNIKNPYKDGLYTKCHKIGYKRNRSHRNLNSARKILSANRYTMQRYGTTSYYLAIQFKIILTFLFRLIYRKLTCLVCY